MGTPEHVLAGRLDLISKQLSPGGKAISRKPRDTSTLKSRGVHQADNIQSRNQDCIEAYAKGLKAISSSSVKLMLPAHSRIQITQEQREISRSRLFQDSQIDK
jgi:hypothetical protein